MSRPYQESSNLVAFILGLTIVMIIALPSAAHAAPLSDTDIQQQTVDLLASAAETQIIFVKFAHTLLFALGFNAGMIR